MKSIVVAVLVASLATLVGCSGEAVPQTGESTESSQAGMDKAQAALDRIESRIVLDKDGNLVSPPSAMRYSTKDMTMDDALHAVDPSQDSNTEARSMCAGGYGAPLVCCTVGEQCCLRAGYHFECF